MNEFYKWPHKMLESRKVIRIAITVVLLLLVPFVAMQFTEEVKWTLSDFLIMGTILFAFALAYEWVATRSEERVYRIAFGIGLAGTFLLFWVNGAVGIIGNEGQPANLLYAAVFIVGLCGSIIARFNPIGMSYTMFAMAVTQILVPLLALLIWPPPNTSWSPGIFGVFLLNAFFTALFILSAFLFRRGKI